MNRFAPELLECLAAIVEEGGFERAAKRLSITQSAVSQRLRALETHAGTVLIVRRHPLKPTPAGRLLLKHTMQLRLLHSDLEHDLRKLSPGTSNGAREEDRVSIAVNADSIATWALPALDALMQQGLPLEIITDDQDFTQDWLREGQVLGCVTTLQQVLRGCKIVSLGAMAYVAVASKAAIERFCPDGLSPHSFRKMPFIAFNRKDDLQAEFISREFRMKQVNLNQCFVPSSEGQVKAAVAGWGASVVPELLVRPLLDSGDLIDLAPGSALPVELYWHCWNLESTLLDSLTRAITAAADRCLRRDGKNAKRLD
ncbi:LysR family transcriptional regulator ArgP [Propionivibrio sp.]|uniref:LysR family transcriptional regulator ArgP n=1 Tax=Propionivibrio sp. TaxID=2212460 RepID=UPI0039E28DC6